MAAIIASVLLHATISFFARRLPSHHAILRDFLCRRLDDAGVIGLIDLILESGKELLTQQYSMVYFPGDDLFAVNRRRGLPIGNLTSQFWANVYMNCFDHFVKRELGCRGYMRYVDDFLLFANDKRTLWRWRSAVVDRLAHLRLTIHGGAHPRPVIEGISFLGFIVFPRRRRLKPRKGIGSQRRLKHLVARHNAGEIELAAVKVSFRGWINHARYGNTVGLQKALLKQLLCLKSPAKAGRHAGT